MRSINAVKRNLKRFKKFISLLYPRNIYKILAFLYSNTDDLAGTRTEILISVIDNKKYKTFLEAKVWQGSNLLAIAKNFPGLICYGVDPYSASSFDEYYKGEIMALVDEEYYEKLFHDISTKVKSLENVIIIRKTSEEAAKNFPDESLDIIFIDAKHDYDSVIKDINIWLPKVKVGGVLSDHNYGLNYFGVIEAVNELIGYDNVSIKSDDTWFFTKR